MVIIVWTDPDLNFTCVTGISRAACPLPARYMLAGKPGRLARH